MFFFCVFIRLIYALALYRTCYTPISTEMQGTFHTSDDLYDMYDLYDLFPVDDLDLSRQIDP